MVKDDAKAASVLAVTAVVSAIVLLLTFAGGIAVAKQFGYWSYPLFFGLDMTASALLLLFIIPMRPNRVSLWLGTIGCLSWIRRKILNLHRALSNPKWQKWRRHGDHWYLLSLTTVYGPAACAVVIRLLGMGESNGLRAAVVANAFANALRITVYLWFGDLIIRLLS